MSAVETASLMSDVGLNISQLRILLRILRNKLGAKMFEPGNIMKRLSGDMIVPKFGEYNTIIWRKELKKYSVMMFIKQKNTSVNFKKK